MTHFSKGRPYTKEEIARLLRQHQVLPTEQRVEIAQLLFAEPQHLSADQVMALANRGRSVVSKATVYNTLGLLARKGLLREVIVDPNKVFYDSNTGPHHHIYDVDSGVLTDVAPEQLAIARLPELPAGTVPVGVDVIVRIRRLAGSPAVDPVGEEPSS